MSRGPRFGEPGPTGAGRVVRALECGAVFVGLPLLLALRVVPVRPIPALLLVALAAAVVLGAEGQFELGGSLRLGLVRPHWKATLVRTAVLAGGLAACVALVRPDLLFSFPRANPRLWGAVMLFYPLVSVFPQELVFRAYFFHRYGPLFGPGWPTIVASAAAFGLVHLIFGSWVSVGLSALGGLLFASTYARTGSLLLTCLEHAIYGDVIFTVGLGRYFYLAR